MRAYLKQILFLMGPDIRRLPWMVFLFLLASGLDLIGLGLIVPYFYLIMGMPVDGSRLIELLGRFGLQSAGREQLLLTMGGVLVGVFLLKAVLGLWGNYNILKFSLDQQVRLKSMLMNSFLSMPYTEYLRRNSAEYIHSIQSLTSHYVNLIVPLLKMVSDGIVAVVILAFLAWKSFVALALMVVVFGGVIGGYHWAFRKRLRSQGHQVNQIAVQVGKSVREGMDGLKEIRVLGKEAYFHDEVTKGSLAYAKASVHSQTITAAPRFLLELLLISFVALLVWVTVQLGHDLQTLAPVLALFGMAALRLLPMINSFSSGLLALRFNQSFVVQLYADVRRIPGGGGAGRTTRKVSQALTDFRALTLNRVIFKYPDAKVPALDGISMEIRSGESIGLIGTSGSGKTTLVDALLGLLEPQQGEIRYNDQPLQESMAQWRSQVAYLPQQVFLIDDSLRANVALGEKAENVDQQRLEQALYNARLSELVKQLPQGVDTLLGERGVRLSGGQRQRIAIARAFYYGRSVLVMDEATSALDNETEQEIVDEIRRLKREKTMIVIAHRLTTVMHCDRIYRLEQGRIVEVGSAAEMLA